MQSILIADEDLTQTKEEAKGSSLFAFICFFVLLLSSALASFAPLGFSIATVFLFAGPHNWVELRYFLSRLPSGFGPLKNFFLLSFSGVAFLGLAFAALSLLNRLQVLNYAEAVSCIRLWLFMLHTWLILLVLNRKAGKTIVKAGMIGGLTALLIVALDQALYYMLFLVYLHPLIGLFILDRELKRSRPQWLKPYRSILLFLPVLTAAMIIQLQNSPSIPQDSLLAKQISQHAGSFLLTDLSTHMLVSVHSFLEMVHYAVWIFAIPLVTQALIKGKWHPDKMPVIKSFKPLRKLLPALFACTSLLVLALWAGFLVDYSNTRDIYFTVAIFHILAELPFLLWML